MGPNLFIVPGTLNKYLMSVSCSYMHNYQRMQNFGVMEDAYSHALETAQAQSAQSALWGSFGWSTWDSGAVFPLSFRTQTDRPERFYRTGYAEKVPHECILLLHA